MKVLLVKTSSLGDVIHALPAVNEAFDNVTGLDLSWVVEESFADIPRLHKSVGRVIPVALRRWRKSWWQSRHEIRAFIRTLRDTEYDLIIDSQGLLKSALLAATAKGGQVRGFDSSSAREFLAASFYGAGFFVAGDQHAVMRQKQLMSRCLGYTATDEIDYGLGAGLKAGLKVMLLHGTTWESKEWPLHCWQSLAETASNAGYEVLIPAGSDLERERARMISAACAPGRGRVLDRVSLQALGDEMRECAGVVSVDTGLGHLGAALGLPVIGIYGSTDPHLTSMAGRSVEIIVSDHLRCIPCKKRTCQFPIPEDSRKIYPPCLEQSTPESVWQAFQLRTGSKDIRPD